MRACVLTLLFTISFSLQSQAHQDFWATRDYGNVKVRIETGFDYEEINKSWIIAELARRLCVELNYNEPVFIDLHHHYTSDCDPDYFISFDKGAIQETYRTEQTRSILKANSLVVREVARSFSPETTLRLLEYAILNFDAIRSEQKSILYEQNYCQWKIHTIDTLKLKEVANANLSGRVAKILSTRVDRGAKPSTINYYFENGTYGVYYTDYSTKDSFLLELKNIYQFSVLSAAEALVFDSDSSFYYVHAYGTPKVSGRHIIEDARNNFRPIEVVKTGAHFATLSFSYSNKEKWIFVERSLLYNRKTDELVQDLDSAIKKQ